MEDLRRRFSGVWLVDYEFGGSGGDPQEPRCVVAHELFSGQVIRMWEHEMRGASRPPYPVSDDVAVVAYYASAELKCHLALGWPLPENVIDLYVEFRVLTNGQTLPSGTGLLGALNYFNLDAMSALEKDAMRDLALRGGPYTSEESRALVDYCAGDVDALVRLLPAMLGKIHIGRALARGEYMKALARMEHLGVPLDNEYLRRVQASWPGIKRDLIARVDESFGVFDGEVFKHDRFEKLVRANGIAWPRLESGRLRLDDDAFRDLSRVHSFLGPLHELRVTLAQLRLDALEVGRDGRNRSMLSAYSTRTGRNAPSTTKFIYGNAKWVRGFIKPSVGMALGYVDYVTEEFGIAASLSGDPQMMDAYNTGDPHLAFAVQAGAAPRGATKKTHGAVRDRFKLCNLGVLFGTGSRTLGEQIALPTAYAEDLLRLHRASFPRYWKWSNGVVDYAMMHGRLHTAFGWAIHPRPDSRPASLRNWPVQSAGAEVMRMASCLLTEHGIQVCAPVHDAFLIEAPAELIDEQVALTQLLMEEAGRIVLDGFTLRTDATIIRYPGRYADDRGAEMWGTVANLVGRRDDE